MTAAARWWCGAWVGAVLLAGSGCAYETRMVHSCQACLDAEPQRCGHSQDDTESGSVQEALQGARNALCAALHEDRGSSEFRACALAQGAPLGAPAPRMHFQCTHRETNVPRPWPVFKT